MNDTNKDDERKKTDEDKGAMGELVKFLLAATSLTALVFWPFAWGFLTDEWTVIQASGTVTPLGTVQKIYFVGGLITNTQVETESRTLLLFSRVIVAKGTALELREDYFGRQVCVKGTQRCWRALI